MKTVGKRLRAIDWKQRTKGELHYTADLRPESMLHAAVLRSPYPYARIESIEIEQARQSPGVHAVVTAADLAQGIRYLHEGAADRPPLADGVVRFVGQEVAAVAAESLAQAQAALRKIVVDYEPATAPLNVASALSPGALSLHNRKSGISNLSRFVKRIWGELAPARERSSITVEGTYRFPRQAHACMEPQAATAHWKPSEQRLHLWSPTQAPYFVAREVSHALGLDAKQVVCHEVGVGGGFGARSKICEHEVITALLARATAGPVRLKFTREEEFETTKTRHPISTMLRLHADSTGRVLALDGKVDVENGAYDHSGVSVLTSSIKALGMLYRPDGAEFEGRLIDTAMQPGGQFRGYGSIQTSFALESLMDELAERCGRDAVALRRDNANKVGETTLAGARLGSARLVECLDAASHAIGWRKEKENRRYGRGVGIAAAVHVSGAYVGPGSNRSDAAIDILPDSRVRVRFGGADAGTGQRTILAQVAAEVLGVELEAVDVLTMDSDRTPFDMGAWSSRGTHYGCHAVQKCAIETAHRLKTLAALKLGDGPLTLEDGKVVSGANFIPIGVVASLSNDAVDGILTTETSFVETNVEPPDPVTGRGNISPSYNFAAHAAVVEVDSRTGVIKVVDYVAAHDIGTAINPISTEGQAIGGVAMGIGPTLGEDLIYEQGKLVNSSYIHYALPRCGDLPRIRPILIEGGDPLGPFGAKAIGECSINPPPAALANAVFDAIGVRIRDLPMTPDKILTALAERDGRRRYHALWRRPSRWWIALVRWAYPRGLLQLLHRRVAPPVISNDPVPIESLVRPSSLDQALSLLDQQTAVVAGGTDLHPRRRQRLLTAPRLVSLRDIESLRGVRWHDDGAIEIGAMTTLSAFAAAMRSRLPFVTAAIEMIASPQIREMATVGGNLLQEKRCWFYRSGFSCYKRAGGLAPCYAVNGDHRFYHAVIDGHRCQATTPSDLASILASLDAQAVIVSGRGERSIPILSLYSGPGETTLAADEIVRAIVIPAAAAGRTGAFTKLRLWEGDFAIVSAAITAKINRDGQWSSPRVVMGGIAPVPWRARATERAIAGQPTTALLRQALDRELDSHAHPLAHNGWKLDAAAGVAEQAIEKILAGPQEFPTY